MLTDVRAHRVEGRLVTDGREAPGTGEPDSPAFPGERAVALPRASELAEVRPNAATAGGESGAIRSTETPPREILLDGLGSLHPKHEDEVVALVQWARRTGRRLRQSLGRIGEGQASGSRERVVVLDLMRALSYRAESGEVAVGAGAILRRASRRSGRSTEPDICEFLQLRSRALPALAGRHGQGIGGILAGGCLGGSAYFDLHTAVVGLRMIDGRGEVVELRRGVHDEMLNAVLVSGGQCGIITAVTLRTEPAYELRGTEAVASGTGDSLALFRDDVSALSAFLGSKDYARVTWYPQREMQHVVLWEARRVQGGDTAMGEGHAGRAAWPEARVVVAACAEALRRFGGRSVMARRAVAWLRRPRVFRCHWHDVMSHRGNLLPKEVDALPGVVCVPLDVAGIAMRALDARFDAQPKMAHEVALALSAAPASSHWMHPAYGRASLAVRVLSAPSRSGKPAGAIIALLLEALAPFTPRYHSERWVSEAESVALSADYPRFPDFEGLCRRLDPDRVFSVHLNGSAARRGAQPTSRGPEPTRAQGEGDGWYGRMAHGPSPPSRPPPENA